MPVLTGNANTGMLLKLACVGVLLLSACAPQDRCAGLANNLPLVRVLFIGNSYTYVNDLPGMFRQLACAGGWRVEVAMEAPGGWTLAQHAASAETTAAIRRQKWEFVILQEQSEIPASSTRAQIMYPAVRDLVYRITGQGSMPVLFLTWGHRDGSANSGQGNFKDMQAALTSGYTAIAREMTLPIAPVGPAWQLVVGRDGPPELWQADGSHPTENGTYLAACVFYATVFNQSPEGLDYRAGVEAKTAGILQAAAAETVLKGSWR